MRPAPGRMGPRLALLTFAIGLAAVNTGNNLLYLMLSLVLGLAATSVLMAWRAVRRMRVTAHLPEEVVCGDPFVVGAEVTGRFPFLPQTWVDLRIDGFDSPVDLSVAVPSDRGRGVASGRATLERRGLYESVSITAATGYPLDLSSNRTIRRHRADLVALPRFRPIRTLKVAGRALGLGAPHPSRRLGAPPGADLRDLRSYAPRDDARRIDWKSSARTGRLMVRDPEREEEARLDLVLDTEAPRPEAFEPVVERAASILDLARRQGLDARLIVPGGSGPLAGRDAMRHLACASPVGPGSLNGQLDAAIRAARPGASLIVLSADPSRATPLEIA